MVAVLQFLQEKVTGKKCSGINNAGILHKVVKKSTPMMVTIIAGILFYMPVILMNVLRATKKYESNGKMFLVDNIFLTLLFLTLPLLNNNKMILGVNMTLVVLMVTMSVLDLVRHYNKVEILRENVQYIKYSKIAIVLGLFLLRLWTIYKY